MRIVDRYITGSIVGIFLSTIFTFCCLYILIDVFSNLDNFIEKKVAGEVILQYYISFLPNILVNTSPMACLIATLFTYSNLNSHNEVIALRASGMNFWALTRPAICFGLIVSAAIFLINERFVPQSTLMSQEIRTSQIDVKAPDKTLRSKPIIRNMTFYGLKNRLYFIDTYDPNTFELTGITIIGQDNNQNLKEKIVAYRGVWTGIAWKFFNCQITAYDTAKPNNPAEARLYPEKLMDIKETPQDFLKQRLDVSAMNIRQLTDYLKRFSKSGAVRAVNNMRVDVHQKITYPLGNLVIILVGLPLASMTGRRKAVTFTSIGIAMMIGFLYYVANAVGLALGKGGALPPIVSAWLTPVIFTSIAIYLIKRKF